VPCKDHIILRAELPQQGIVDDKFAAEYDKVQTILEANRSPVPMPDPNVAWEVCNLRNLSSEGTFQLAKDKQKQHEAGQRARQDES
jgi:hypothetical protein